jgi:plasmid stability protein
MGADIFVDLEDEVVAKLVERARLKGVSLEDEARAILVSAADAFREEDSNV